ncbi:hypothetical protein QJS10_CPB11g01330 [Acorus calamus]|uniref:Uncharacterized protein n=1 Tax=Acorus calamus TaxID=4465 RepID=A0AAV9DU08_ACOCL|nr:hypothetical protein QJS10_CPB11g01330 [Acorus calamus]
MGRQRRGFSVGKKRALKRVIERHCKEPNMWESLSSTLANMKSKIPSTRHPHHLLLAAAIRSDG